MGRTPVEDDAADDAGVGFGDEEGVPGVTDSGSIRIGYVSSGRVRRSIVSLSRRMGGPEPLMPCATGMGG